MHFRLEPNAIATKEYARPATPSSTIWPDLPPGDPRFYDAGSAICKCDHRLGLSVLAGTEKSARTAASTPTIWPKTTPRVINNSLKASRPI